MVMNIIDLQSYTTKEGEAILDFLKNKHIRNKNTGIAYRNHISQFVESVFEKKIEQVTKSDLSSLNKKVLSNYFLELHKQNKNGEIRCSNNTLNRKMAAIKQLLKFLAGEEIVSDIRYLESIEQFTDDSEEIPYMPPSVAEKYVEYFLKHERFKAYEKHMFAIMAIDTALRMGELLSLKWSQFREQDNYVVLSGRGKGNKKWIDKIDKSVFEKLKVMKTNENDKVFSLSSKNVDDMMRRASKDLGYENRGYTFHSFKKTAVTFTYEVTGSMRAAQNKGRHEKSETTEVYLKEHETQMTGMYSLQNGLDHELYKKVDHETLIKGIANLSEESRFVLNIKLKEILKKLENENEKWYIVFDTYITLTD